MIPQQVLSSQSLPAPFNIPDPQPSDIISRELGGIALNDPTQGLEVQVWIAELIGDDVTVSAPLALPTVLFSRPNITEISLAFDQNMRPFIAFVEAGQAKFYWYDSLIEDFAFTNLPVGSITPRATLDDHREFSTTSSDIILSYIRDGSLMFRAQRDRYTIEYLLYEDLNLFLINPRLQAIGMSENLRLRFDLLGSFG